MPVSLSLAACNPVEKGILFIARSKRISRKEAAVPEGQQEGHKEQTHSFDINPIYPHSYPPASAFEASRPLLIIVPRPISAFQSTCVSACPSGANQQKCEGYETLKRRIEPYLGTLERQEFPRFTSRPSHRIAQTAPSTTFDSFLGAPGLGLDMEDRGCWVLEAGGSSELLFFSAAYWRLTNLALSSPSSEQLAAAAAAVVCRRSCCCNGCRGLSHLGIVVAAVGVPCSLAMILLCFVSLSRSVASLVPLLLIMLIALLSFWLLFQLLVVGFMMWCCTVAEVGAVVAVGRGLVVVRKNTSRKHARHCGMSTKNFDTKEAHSQ